MNLQNFIQNLKAEVVARVIDNWGGEIGITYYADHTIAQKAKEAGLNITIEEASTIAQEINAQIAFLESMPQKKEATADYKKALLVEGTVCHERISNGGIITLRNPKSLLLDAKEKRINITPEEATEIATYFNTKVEEHNQALQEKNGMHR